jgi:membrane-bound lytic murein transglycosylase D
MNNCQLYYNCRVLDEYYRPIYAELLEEYSDSRIYETLPIALSASNPGLQINGDRAGIWQLSYVVARRYGLEINSLIDERMDVTRSTYAAIQHFLFLEQLFPNRPLLVISAFYTSVLYVNKKLSRLNEDTDKAFFQTIDADLRNFILYVDAWNDWVNNFKLHKNSDLISKAHEKWKNIEVKDTVEIKVLSDFLGLNISLLRTMNPVWVGDFITEGTEVHPFYLPKGKADFIQSHYDGFIQFQQKIEEEKRKELLALKKRMANDIPDPNKYMAIDYKVQSGDVLGLIAQRNGVKVSSIKKWNKLNSDRINIGQNLILYVPKGNKSNLPEIKAEDKVETNSKSLNKEPKPGKGTYTSYIVKDGDSLWLIARKYPGVSSENIMEWNGINDKISPGQTLKIFGPE